MCDPPGAHLVLPILVALACGSPKPAEPPKNQPMPSAATAPEPLCKVLRPQLETVTRQFNLGGALICENIPGVVTLGQFGVRDQLDRNLLACVDHNAQFTGNVAIEPAAVSGIEYSTLTTTDANGSLGLGRIAPWLPDIKIANGAGEQLRVRLSVSDATWETLPSVGRIFEAQNHAFDCLPTLCHDEARLVYKILRGRVTVDVHADSTKGLSSGVTLLGGGSAFALDEQSKTSSKVSLGSNDKLVLAIVAKPSKPELTEGGHCDGCGARGQACCEASAKCDGDLSCLDGVCRPPGYPGAPCDSGKCSNSATCVRGICRTGCGTEGLPCCDKDGCADGHRCQVGQPARREVFAFDESIERTGGLFGTDAELELGSGTCGDGRLRSRFATIRLEGDSAHCDDAAWMGGSDMHDCRVKVHVHVSPFSKIRCRIQVFATEVDPGAPKAQSLCR